VGLVQHELLGLVSKRAGNPALTDLIQASRQVSYYVDFMELIYTSAGVKFPCEASLEHVEPGNRLTEVGLPETAANVQVKINRGAFPAWEALRAIGVGSLRLE
jgi:hypothetical protein